MVYSHPPAAPGLAELALPPPWLELALYVGGASSLARELGVSRMTVWRWAHGRASPPLVVRDAVNQYARSRGYRPPWPQDEVARAF